MSALHTALRERLEAEKIRLTHELDQLVVSGAENTGYSTHMADDASAAFDQARDLALRDNLERTLTQVQEALNRFETGTYGICESCGKPIDPARLKALPHVAYCLECQRRSEV
jgi:RNA polymerase-binding protein DksA